MKNKKVVVIGDDGLIPELVLKFRKNLPNIDKMMRNGIFAPSLPSPPVDTPTNWTTIATGSWTKTHGIRGFSIPQKGKHLNEQTGTFNKFLCKSEYLWEALERQGKKTILISYPTAIPFRTKKSIIVGGDGPFISQQWCFSSPEYYYSEGKFENATKIKLVKAKGWKNLLQNKITPLEGIIPLTAGTKATWTKNGWKILGREKGEGLFYYVLITGKEKYEQVYFSKEKDFKKVIFSLKKGEWSGDIVEKIKGKGEGSFKIKICELSDDGKNIGIFRTAIDSLHGWGYPEKVEKEIIEKIGPYHQGFELNAFIGFVSGWADFSLAEEVAQMQCDYLVKAVEYLSKNYPFDLFMVQIHLQDAFNHRFLGYLSENSPFYDKKTADKYWGYLLRTHKLTDKLVGEIIEKTDDGNTTFILLSDHGAIPVYRQVFLEGLLIKKGYVKFRNKKGKVEIDWKRTKAWIDGYNCWVNLKGRTPDGCVEKKDYEKMRDELIRFLYSLKDPITGECPVSVAVRKEDAEIFGLAGENVGDIVFFMKEGYWNIRLGELIENFTWDKASKYVKNHSMYGPKRNETPVRVGSHEFIPGANIDGFSNRGTFIISGPDIEKNIILNQINIVDIAPTICEILKVKPPRNSEGFPIFNYTDVIYKGEK